MGPAGGQPVRSWAPHDRRRCSASVRQPVALACAQARPLGDYPVLGEQPPRHLGDVPDAALVSSPPAVPGEVVLVIAVTHSFGLSGEGGALDPGHRRCLVVVGGVAGDADGSE